MGNTSCKCRKTNIELNSRYFILAVDDGSQEAKELHLYPLQIEVNEFFAGAATKLQSSNPPPPPPYNGKEGKEEDESEESEKVERKMEESESENDSENIIPSSNTESKSKPTYTTADLDREIAKAREEVDPDPRSIKNVNNNDNEIKDNRNGDTNGNEVKKKSTVIFQIYHCQSHINSKEEVVHIKAIAVDGNVQGSGYVRYEREGLKGIREMVISVVPHAELGYWYQWQIHSPSSSLPIPLADLSVDTPIRLFNLSDQSYLSYNNDQQSDHDVDNYFGNRGVAVTFFLKPMHLHYISSDH